MTHPSDTEKLALDCEGVGSKASRARLERAVRGLGCKPSRSSRFWAVFETGVAATPPPNLLVLADLSRCARIFRAAGRRAWTAAVRDLRPFIVALIRNARDRRHAAMVDDLVAASDNRLAVCDLDPHCPEVLWDCLSRAIAGTSAESVLDVRYAPDEDWLWLQFGDGLHATLPWSRLGIGGRALRKETITPSDDLASIEVLRDDGRIFDIDSSLVRALVDERHAERLQDTAASTAEDLGARLRRKRKAAGLTQQALAARCGLEQALISKLERGRHRPRIDTLRRYAAGLGRSVAELLG